MSFLAPLLHASILLAGVASISASPPQEEIVVKKTKAQDDLEFAVNLARYRYFDLANEFVEDIKKGRLSDEEKESLAITNASILKLAAEYSTEDSERLDFYNRAIAQFKDFVQYGTLHPQYDQMRLDLADVYQNLGRFLYEQMQREENPDKVAVMKQQAEESFREGVQLLNDTGRALETKAELLQEPDPEAAEKAGLLARQCLYKKGISYYLWALMYEKDDFNREDYLTRTISTLDDYIWDSPEDDFYVLWSYVYQSMAYTEMGEFTDAIDLARQVYDPQTGIDLDQAVNLAPEYAKLITDLAETAFYQVARIYNRINDYEKAVATIDQMLNDFASRKLELSPKGDLGRLEQAKALLQMNDAEKTDKAAQICREVGDRNPTNNAGWEAKKILKDIIEGASSPDAVASAITISPDVLFSAAEGYKLEQKLQDAIRAYMRVIRACNTVQQKEEFLAKTWNAIGTCYSQLQPERRWLEASIAFEQGFKDPNRGQDKEIYQRNATNWYSALMRRHKETKDLHDNRKMKSARDLLVQLDLGSEDLVFLIALDKFNKALGDTGKEKEDGMTDAMQDFKEVDRKSVLYARSLVYLARCSFEIGKYDEALRAFDSFEREVETLPQAGTQKQRTYRTIALAEGAFWRSETLLRMGEALSKDKKTVSKARERYQEAFDVLKGFESEYKTQQDFFPAVMYNRVIAKLGIQQFDEAEKLYNDLKDKFPDSNRTSTAAYYIGLALIGKAQEERTDASAPPSKEYIAALKKGTEYMKNYCEVSGYDSFTNLKNVCEWYQELGDLGEAGAHETSRDTYQILLKEFGADAEYEEQIQGNVYRGYAEVLNKLRDFETAKPIWLRLLKKDSKNVGILKATALCMGGWLEEKEDGTLVEVPGTGDYAPELSKNRDPNKISLDNAYNIWNYLLTGITHRGDRGSPEWYEAKFYTAYILYRAGVKNPTYFEWSRKIISNLRVLHPDMGGTEFRRKFKFVEDSITRKR